MLKPPSVGIGCCSMEEVGFLWTLNSFILCPTCFSFDFWALLPFLEWHNSITEIPSQILVACMSCFWIWERQGKVLCLYNAGDLIWLSQWFLWPKKSVNVSLPVLWILKKTPVFCWKGAFESCFLSAGKFLIFRCICMWKSFGCCFFCDGVVILISVLFIVFQSHIWQHRQTDSGLDVLFLELCRVSGLTSWMARKIFNPCYYFLSIIPLVSVTVLVLAIAEAVWPGRGIQALSPKGLLVSISHYIHVMSISTLHLCSQICTVPWERAKKELVGWYYFGKKCYFR